MGAERVEDWLEDTQQILQLAADSPRSYHIIFRTSRAGRRLLRRREGSHLGEVTQPS